VVALTFNLGFRQIHQPAAPAPTLRVTAMQPSIPQTLIWDESKNDERFHELLRLCDQVLTNQTDLILWPESAVPDLLRYDTNTFEAVTGLARRHHAWMIICADDAELRPGSNSFKDADFFNSSFLISPEGRIEERYIKRNLVIFGEYIPLVRWLPFIKWFTPIQGGFTPGTRANPFEFRAKDLAVSTSVLICFEDIFPQLGREGTRPNTDFLVNLTNDGWFDESGAQWQQAASALFRAVENHVPLIRCTNNGLTCWVDACGRMREVFRDERNSVYGAGFMTFEIPVLAGATRPRTFYNEHGDWFGWACVGLAVLMVARKRKQLMSIGAQNSNPARQ
jgi:apolipoprotein N-acyltransferase